ncbi:DUF2000 family protein [Kutzneria kofuensis]|uniref:DUF2000 domain-containing protein n=1 Tax=Kutzneria kofuensis TaxID=103725 RepID=A0A7W9KCR0_9PSEU|nr:DUF2000 family protein [Kutzneria kofuensis]MBB5889399.1 hypothetical protein [Kutzneria kofuensis]
MTEQGPLRAAIVVHKSLDPAAVANAAAILMGQLAHLEPRLYATDGVKGADGVRHAGIRYNTVILAGRPAQVGKLIAAAAEADVPSAVFGGAGRGLHNSFEAYQELVGRSTAEELEVFAVGLAGPDELVRSLTKQFSSYRGPVVAE